MGILKRDLDRAWASLALEEHRNRNVPPLEAISSPEESDKRANESVTKYLEFLETQDILPMRDYMDRALRERIGSFTPEEQRNFFATCIAYEPMTLYDLSGDPMEQDPVADRPEIYNELSDALRQHVNASGQIPWQRAAK